VNGVDANVVIGAYRIPGNQTIEAVEDSGKDTESSGAFETFWMLFQ
jgi:hypothetical protein